MIEKNMTTAQEQIFGNDDTGDVPNSVNEALKTDNELLADTETAINHLATMQSSFADFEKLEGKAKIKLYELLGSIFKIVSRINFYPEADVTSQQFKKRNMFVNALEKRLLKNNQKLTSATSLEAKVLRFVCGDISAAREKAWVRVLKVAGESEELFHERIKFEEWLEGEGGVYEVANTKANGVKPSQRDEHTIDEAVKFVTEWNNSFDFNELSSVANRKVRDLPDELKNFSVTLNFNDGGKERGVVEVFDKQAIQRLLVLLGKQLKPNVPTKAETEADEQAALENFIDATGTTPEVFRE